MSEETFDIDEFVIPLALEVGFMLSTQYGQGIHKLMPVSDRATLTKFARLCFSKGLEKGFKQGRERGIEEVHSICPHCGQCAGDQMKHKCKR
jgi:hypothetical protein